MARIPALGNVAVRLFDSDREPRPAGHRNEVDRGVSDFSSRSAAPSSRCVACDTHDKEAGFRRISFEAGRSFPDVVSTIVTGRREGVDVDFARFFDEGLTIAIGIYFLLLGYRVIGKRPGLSPKYDAWHARSQGFLIFAALLMIGTGVIRLLWFSPVIPVKVAEPASLEWRTVTTSDGVLKVKMPGKPEFQTKDERGDLGPTKFVKQLVRIYGDTVIFSLLERHYLDEDVQFDRALFLDSTAKGVSVPEGRACSVRGRSIAARSRGRRSRSGRRRDTPSRRNSSSWGDVRINLRGGGGGGGGGEVVIPDAMTRSPIVGEFFESLAVDEHHAEQASETGVR